MNIKKRIIKYLSLLVFLIALALFFTISDLIIFSKISLLPEKMKLSIIIFSTTMINSLIFVYYLSHKSKTYLYEKKNKIEEAHRKLSEAHKFCSEQRKLFNDIFEMFSKNLEDTIKKTEESIADFIKLLEWLYQKSKEQTELIKSSVKSGGELVEIIQKQILHNTKAVDILNQLITLHYKSLSENLDRFFIIREKVKDIIPLMDSIKDISEQINILSINAAIEAARVGQKGTGFAVIVDEIRKLSNKTERISKEIKDKIISLNHVMSEQYEFFQKKLEESEQSEILENLENFKEATMLMEKDFSRVGTLIGNIVNQIDKQNEIIFGVVTDLLGKTQFQDVVRQKLEKVCDKLEEISKYNSQLLKWVENPEQEQKPVEIKTLLEKFYQSYVMQSQRRIYVEIFNETYKVDEKEPKIELF